MPSFRYRNDMERQVSDLLLYYRETERVGGMSLNDLIETAIDLLWQTKVAIRQPEPPHIVGWVRGRTSDGREGWKPQLSNGSILDEIDNDVD